MTDKAIQKRFSWRKRNLPWYPRIGTRTDLALLFGELGFTKGVEIGTQYGSYAKILLESNSNLHLICIDPWAAYDHLSQEKQDRRYDKAIETLQGLNYEIIRKPSIEAVTMFKDNSLDFVYIDGNHVFDYVMLDLIHWSYKVKKGGIIATHDYHAEVGADVRAAIDAYTRSHYIDPWYVTREHLPTAFWVKQ